MPVCVCVAVVVFKLISHELSDKGLSAHIEYIYVCVFICITVCVYDTLVLALVNLSDIDWARL